MKWTISINQRVFVELGLDIDFQDAAIFDFFVAFTNSKNAQKIETSLGTYFWLSHGLIIKNLPMLGIKSKRGIMNRVNNLIEAKLIEKHPDCDKMGRTYYCLGENYDRATFDTTHEQKFIPPHEQKFIPPMNKSSDYTNINDTTISNNSIALFPELEIEKVKSTIFRNCDLLKDGVFPKVFEKEIEAGIDVSYYMTKVERWSNKNEGKKRKFYGWRDTVADFMDGDRKSGKLEMITKVDNTESDDYYLRL